MAFTEAQKESIRMYLGFPAGYDADNTRLEEAMDEVGASATQQATVEAILTKLSAVDAALAATGGSSSTMGPLKKADDVEWYDVKDGVSAISPIEFGEMLIAQLAQRFGYSVDELPFDYFGGSAGGGAGVASCPKRECWC